LAKVIYLLILSEQDLEGKDTKALCKEVETQARETINWYIKRKGNRAAGSKFLRISAILLIFAGGLSPILQGIAWLQLQDCQYGYIALALAAACVAIDKFMGLSSSWMRSVTGLERPETVNWSARFTCTLRKNHDFTCNC